MPGHFYYTYITASRTRVLYTGVTGHIERRMDQRKRGAFPGFAADYRCNRLVWYEQFMTPGGAIAREKQLKSWRREKKLALIEEATPTWIDLSKDWGKPVEYAPRMNL